MTISRRELLKTLAVAAAAAALPVSARAEEDRQPGSVPPGSKDDQARLKAWTFALRNDPEARAASFGRKAAHVGELAIGTPYVPNALEAYIRAGGDPRREPLTLSLTEFDCVTLVESCEAVARVAARRTPPGWNAFGHEIERMRYRGGVRRGYASRLHYFSEWIYDGARRGLVTDMARELGGVVDPRPLRFMTDHRKSYAALANDEVFRQIGEMERRLDSHKRYMIPKDRIPSIVDKLQTGDVLAFATSIAGIDVTHSAYAYRRADGVMGVLHAPLSGGAVEISRKSLPDYVAAIKTSTGILVARPHTAV
ncbi:MAG TPA: N-acetylmuramoyl-L-alanine amidase-like domain-containing protein [Gemmatimonadaceae bacterium]|nr:N-acetylmuramoyl-L-alanine amidase-like domain-containing protein [Gemmatimonadaceae bacterium]